MHNYHIRILLHAKAPAGSSSQPHHSHSEYIPTSLFHDLPAQKPKPTSRRNALFNPKHKDYRFGPIRIDWIDFEINNKIMVLNNGKEREKEPQGRSTVTAAFVPRTRSKSGSTNLPEGTVHLFRDNKRITDVDIEASATESSEMNSDGVTLAVLAVPAWMTPSDFLGFVAPAADGMAHLRIIRDSAPNRSIVIIDFPNPSDAAEFAEAYNGKPFISTEPEICHVVRIISIKIDTEDTVSLAISRSSQGSKYELPTCPVCLERMDSAVTGLITVPCSHTFHCMCLSKWGDSRCPVCRYSQTLLTSHPPSASRPRSIPIPFSNPSTPTISTCSSCTSTTNLWICLICGNIGCGRYGRAHAHAHYENTTHLYALELETQRVWDYAGDGYVHRLIQNKADGKLVELPSSSMGGSGREGGGGGGPTTADAIGAEKIEAIGIEYSYLLTSQLESQREYYEEQSTGLKSQVAELRGLVQQLRKDMELEQISAKERETRKRREEEERMSALEKDRNRAEKKAEKVAELARKLEKELREERAVGEGLLKNLGKMRERVELSEKEKVEQDAKVREMEDQVRDLMFFLEAKEKIEKGEGVIGDAVGGSVELPPAPSSSTPTGKKKGRKS